jgi:hypothetical protein
MPISPEELLKRFRYHAPKDGQTQRYERLRDMARLMSQAIVDMTPESREQSLALTRLEEASMWANAAIARNE